MSEYIDSKYNITSSNTKLQPKHKLTPILCKNNKIGPASSKKIKLCNDSTNNLQKVNNSAVIKPKFSIQDQRRNLPIFAVRNELLELIQRHKTLIVLGETGSGKSTQVPQYIHSVGIQGNGKIGITQPRRVAAISVALRVAQEYGHGMDIGDVVGYRVRFEDNTSKKTRIKFLTDGMLLRESMFDRLLMEYNVIILDEAHERTISTDVLFGVVKKAQKLREDRNSVPLKIILMTAVMDLDHLSKYFNDCLAVYIEGRTYLVNLFNTIKPQDNYQTSAVATFFKIHQQAPPEHGVLIFLTGQEEIEVSAHQIRVLSKDPDVKGPPVQVCTLYASQPGSQQLSVFQPAPPNTRKVVISTNIAETSVTISGIKYVIDSGMVKSRYFHPSTGLEMLNVQRISQEQALQRAGRAGRESEGFCYRLYTKSQFELMKKSSVPEIQRTNLTTVALQLLALGIHCMQFDFIDKPPAVAITSAFDLLKLLGAVENVDSTSLTQIGKKMIKFPLDPRFSKILLSAPQYGCLEEALTVVSLLSSESVLINPPNKREHARNVRQKFCSGFGDHTTLLNIYREFNNVGRKKKRNWCHEHFINMRNILHARDIRLQLEEICKSSGMVISSCGSQMDPLRKCLLTGLFTNIAEYHRDRRLYITLDKRQVVQIHPSSTLHSQLPHLVLFTEVVQTTKCYIRALTTIESDWLNEIVPDYVKSHNIKLNWTSS